MFTDLFYKFPRNFADVFSRRNLVWHFVAIAVTYFLVNSGFDWWYFEQTRNETLLLYAMTAAMVGALVPLLAPLAIYAFGTIRKSVRTRMIGVAIIQAEVIALLVSSTYKAFTGRVPPPRADLVSLSSHLGLGGNSFLASSVFSDISHHFNFGFLQHGVFWGWPSSHTTVAFAGAVALVVICARNKTVRYLALLYAFFIGLGVSVTIHWFSDFVAGAIIGSVIGVVVAKSFLNRNS